ncbi:hypothetical protein C1646_767424 [Rhizophagus diaphanus]|nr:hypothetical protein C1646_767424 [Rhizophagus diaphanus] [Rhizophagus sp. MUCL 43196]
MIIFIHKALGDEDDFVLEREVCKTLSDEDDFVLKREVCETLSDEDNFVLKGNLKVFGVEDDFALKGNRKVSDDVLEPRIHKVPYFCSDCEGMLVASRTKNRYELSSQFSSDVSEVIIKNTEIWNNEPSKVLENTENINDKSSQLIILNKQRVDRLPQRCRLRYILTKVSIDSESNNESNGDEESENSNSGTFEDYSCPSFELYQDPDVTPTPTNDDNKFLWILIWIMKFRMRFNIPETATKSLIKFIKLLLEEIGDTAFENFPITLYKARNILNIEDQFHSFAACMKYHKLYNKQEVEEFRQDEILAIMKCQHIKFPNSSKCQKMDNIDEWFVTRDLAEFHENAHEWHHEMDSEKNLD